MHRCEKIIVAGEKLAKKSLKIAVFLQQSISAKYSCIP